MRRLMRLRLALAGTILLGCASAQPLPPQQLTQNKPKPVVAPPHAPLSAGQAHAEILKAQRLPRGERLPLWRKWAADASEPTLQAHALTQLAWAGDAEYSALAVKAFESTYSHVRAVVARGLARTSSSNAIRAALLDALSAASDEERSAILWTLVVHGEKSIAPKALDELRQGRLQKVTELDGRIAFDPFAFANYFSLEECTGLVKDPNPAVRRMAVLRFVDQDDAQTTNLVLAMLGDQDESVQSVVAGVLARIKNKRAHDAMHAAFFEANRERRQKWIESVRDIAGGPGLAGLLWSIPAKPEETVWFQTKQIFQQLEALADPRQGDALVAWASGAPRHSHWLGVLGTRLAEVGDIRGAQYLGVRLRIEPDKLYLAEHFWEADEGGHLTRTDMPRIVAARMLADLAVIHQDKHAELLQAAEASTLEWLKSRPQPHANGLRFLAGAGSKKILPDLRKWAFPSDPLPKPGAMPPFPSAFETAQVGLRYIGLLKDEPSFPKLLEQLQRKKDKTLNITQDGLMEAGMAMLGMSLRAIGYGAASGLAHWGDSRAVAPLMTFIEDETWHEEARQSACEALAWCADAKAMGDVARKVQTLGQSKEPAKLFIAACYAQTLSIRPVPDIVPVLVDMLGPNVPMDLRMAYAHSLGMSGFDSTAEEKLFRKLEDPASRQAAALALVMGGTPDTAARAVAIMAEFGGPVIDELKDHYYRAFGYWSDMDFERGNIYRWVANAEAMQRVDVAGKRQDWAQQRLQAQFANLRFDNGPHSETRVVLRHRLLQDAKSGNAERKRGAFMTLVLMNEQGVLMALQDEPGETGVLARRALHQAMNPVFLAE